MNFKKTATLKLLKIPRTGVWETVKCFKDGGINQTDGYLEGQKIFDLLKNQSCLVKD